MNSKLASKFVPRPLYMDWLNRFRETDFIKVITGVRRCGKSTILRMFADELIQSGIQSSQIHFYNFEDLAIQEIGDIFAINNHITDRLHKDKRNFIFLDEVQNIQNFEQLVDSLFIKPNCDIYITGSNAYMLSGELATLLTGRFVEISMLPFSFKEYFNGIANSEKLTKLESFRNFMYYGSIPQQALLVNSDKSAADEAARSLLSTIIEKDIFTRHEIYSKSTFYKVVDFVFDSIGFEISANSIAEALKHNDDKIDIDSKTVSIYLGYLYECMLIDKISRIDVKGKKILKTLEKFYLVDPSFRKIRLNRGVDVDLGKLLENAVYLELKRRYIKVFIGKVRDKEVDFVVEDGKGYTSYFQVAWNTASESTLERELASLNAIGSSDPKWLITMDFDFNPVYNGIKKVNAVDWFLGDEL